MKKYLRLTMHKVVQFPKIVIFASMNTISRADQVDNFPGELAGPRKGRKDIFL